MHLAVELFGWVLLVSCAGCGLLILCTGLYIEIWQDKLKRRWNEPRVCVNCKQVKFQLVPHCQDCVDLAQRKLGEKW